MKTCLGWSHFSCAKAGARCFLPFLNLMISPKGQAALAESSGYTPVNPAAIHYMSKETIANTGMENPRGYLGSAIFKQGVNNPSLYNEVMEEVIAGLK